MANRRDDDPATFPALGRALLWVERPGGVEKIVYALYAVCAGLFAAAHCIGFATPRADGHACTGAEPDQHAGRRRTFHRFGIGHPRQG